MHVFVVLAVTLLMMMMISWLIKHYKVVYCLYIYTVVYCLYIYIQWFIVFIYIQWFIVFMYIQKIYRQSLKKIISRNKAQDPSN